MVNKILQMDVFQVEEGCFYARIVSNRERGVAVLLYKALDSLKRAHVRSSNLASHDENYVLTFTLHVSLLNIMLYFTICTDEIKYETVILNPMLHIYRLPQKRWRRMSYQVWRCVLEELLLVKDLISKHPYLLKLMKIKLARFQHFAWDFFPLIP